MRPKQSSVMCCTFGKYSHALIFSGTQISGDLLLPVIYISLRTNWGYVFAGKKRAVLNHHLCLLSSKMTNFIKTPPLLWRTRSIAYLNHPLSFGDAC